MEKTAIYFVFCMGMAVGIVPAFFSVLSATEESSRLKMENQFLSERIENLEIYIQGYKEANLTD
jgi:hypothetical protein